MTIPPSLRYGCSPWSLMGCGCGLLAAIGICLVFFILGLQFVHERHDPTWNQDACAQCQDNITYLREAIGSYERDYHHLPASLHDLNGSYLDRTSRLRCPLELRKLGTVYQYHPSAKHPTDMLIRCSNHGQGDLILERSGKIILPTVFQRKHRH